MCINYNPLTLCISDDGDPESAGGYWKDHSLKVWTGFSTLDTVLNILTTLRLTLGWNVSHRSPHHIW